MTWRSLLYLPINSTRLVQISKAIVAYPYEEFKADLNGRSQTILTEQYKEALEYEKIVIFVRDNVKRKLVSYTIAAEDTKENQGAV